MTRPTGNSNDQYPLAALLRHIFAVSGDASAGTSVDPRALGSQLVSLWFSGDFHCATWVWRSGVTLSLWTKLREETPLDHVLASLALLFGFVALASFWLMQRIPFQPFRLLLDRWQFVYMLLYYVVLAAPFFCSGLAISLLLTRGGRDVNRLYAADLLGAGLGCALVCGVMPVFGGSGSVAIAAMLGALAALAFSSFRLSKVTLLRRLGGRGDAGAGVCGRAGAAHQGDTWKAPSSAPPPGPARQSIRSGIAFPGSTSTTRRQRPKRPARSRLPLHHHRWRSCGNGHG